MRFLQPGCMKLQVLIFLTALTPKQKARSAFLLLQSRARLQAKFVVMASTMIMASFASLQGPRMQHLVTPGALPHVTVGPQRLLRQHQLSSHRQRTQDDRHRLGAIAFGGIYGGARSLESEIEALETSEVPQPGCLYHLQITQHAECHYGRKI